jgi:hypothetical protein
MVYTLDPLRDPRWAEFISHHSDATTFHSVPWLEAIQRTYGYSPIVYTTCPPSKTLSNGIVFCLINSWITGRRVVSLPFSDHCEPLLDTVDSAAAISRELKKASDKGRWKYIELRPRREMPCFEGMTMEPACYLHMLDLAPTTDEIFSRLHKSALQASIKRAVRDGVEYQCGNSESLLKAFYRLTTQTRRRQQLPPQPIQWFRNLISCMGERLKIRVAFSRGTEIASILTLQYGSTIVYKYGCSDSRFNKLGATPFLLWNMISEAKKAGMTCVDFGRTDADNQGLLTFKDRWGAKHSPLVYVRWNRESKQKPAWPNSSGTLKRVFTLLPDFVLRAAGHVLYRHVG